MSSGDIPQEHPIPGPGDESRFEKVIQRPGPRATDIQKSLAGSVESGASSAYRALDAGHQAIAAVYAKALLSTTQKSGSTAHVLADLESLVRDVLDKQPKFTAALASPRLSTDEKLHLIDKVFGGRISPELLRFVKVVARHERLAALPAISRTYRKLVNDALGRAAVTVITAQSLPADLRGQVTTTLEARLGKPIDLTTETDPSLIGGMVVRVGDTVYDASVAGRLDRQRRAAIKNSARRLQNK